GEAPGLRERTPPAERPAPVAGETPTPEPPQPRRPAPEAVAGGRMALDLDVARRAIMDNPDIPAERKAEFDKWAKARAAQERGDLAGAEPTTTEPPVSDED